MIGQSSEAVKEQIRQASDIVDVVSAYVTLTRGGRDFKALCPFHSEKTPSFQVSPEKQIFKCFGCGAGGDVFKFIQLRENVTFKEAIAILAARSGIDLSPDKTAQGPGSGPSKVEIARVNDWALRWFAAQFRTPNGAAAREYAASRGLSDESLRRFDIGFAPGSWEALCTAARKLGIAAELLLAAGLVKRRADAGEGSTYDAFRNRLIFPIRDPMNRVVGFGGRALADEDEQAKYINSPQSVLFDKSRSLYGLATAKDAFREHRTAVVVEGYVDCIMAQQYGFTHTVATLGTALTAEHVQLLRRYVDRTILVFDSDEAGRRAADKSLSLFLTAGLDVQLAHVPEQEGKDPADLLMASGPDAFRAVLTSATDALESKWKQVLGRSAGDASRPDRRRAIEEFLGLIARSTDLGAGEPIQRGLILNQVGKLLGLPSEEVYRQLRIVARRQRRPGDATAAPVGQQQADGLSRTPPDAAAVATRQLLEVLINEPSYYDSIAAEFDPRWLPDAGLRQIADAVVRLAREQSGFAVSDLTARFESPDIARMIIALQSAGEQRGNYAATVEGAVACLQHCKGQRRIDIALRAYGRKGPGGDGNQNDPAASGNGNTAETPPPGDGREDADDVSRLRAMSDAARRLNHFASRKHLALSVSEEAAGMQPSTEDRA